MSSPSRPSSERAARRVGQVLRDKYTLERVLGVGGMAAVYGAVHRNKNRVAIKMLHPEISSDDGLRARFVREGYVANSIEHRGVVRVLDDDVTDDGAAFLVIELLQGETLNARVERAGALPEAEVAAVGHELCDVLAAAHEKGIVHRDIKPDNLFLTADGLLKVLDFGIARMADPEGGTGTLTGRVMGTPAFMPPEQALGRGWEIDGRVDVWAAGATMFWLLSGRLVHEGTTTEEQLVLAATRPAPPVATVATGVSPEIAAVVDRALSFAKADRFPSAGEMRDALAAACVTRFGRVPPLPRAPRSDQTAVVQSSSAAADADTVDAQPEARAPTPRGSAPMPTPPAREAASGSWPPPESPPTAQIDRVPTPARPSGPPASAGHPPPRRARPWAIAAAAVAVTIGAVAAWRGARPPAPIGGAPASASAAPLPCAANKDCGAADAVCGRAGVCVPKRGCATAAECTAQLGGKPAICRRDEGTCVALETPECKKLLAERGDLENDATIWLGAMVPLTGPNTDDGSVVKTLDLARRDFASIANGVPGRRPGDPPRPLAILLCDDSGDAAVPARHLVDAVGVPAIIGFNRSKDVTDLAASLFNPKHVLALAALNQSPMLTGIPHAPEGPRLVWRTTSSSAATAVAMAAFIEVELGPKLRLDRDEPARVALVRRDNPNQLALADKLVSLLRVRGKTAMQGGVTVRQFTVDNEAEKPDFTSIRKELVSLVPHVILDLQGGGSFVEDLYPRVEREWPAQSPRPYYVSSGGASTVESELVRRMIAQRPDVRARLFACDTPAKLAPNVKLSIHFNEVYGTKTTPETTFGTPYDAFYVAAYAIAALGDKPVTGLEMARAIPRLLPPGEPVDVGPAAIFEALKVLRAGKSIDLAGTTTSLDYDVDTGDAPVDMVIMCLKRTSKGELVTAESGITYSARTGQLAGKLDCP